MQEMPSLLSLLASAFYAVVLLACIAAARTARSHGQQKWHLQAWALIALFFLALIVSRLLGVEEALRTDLRSWLQAEGLRAERRDYQGFFIATAIGGAVLLGMAAAAWVARKIEGRRNIAVAIAAGSCGVMFAIIALRMISLHAMDRLLYGPLKLNWIGDLGASALVAGAAIYYTLLVMGRIGRQPR